MPIITEPFVVLINGVEVVIAEATLAIDETINGRNVCSFDVVSPQANYRPPMDATVEVIDNGVVKFTGLVTTPNEEGFQGVGLTPIVTHVTCVDGNIFPERRFIIEIIPPGTLKSALLRIVPYLAPYGVTLHPAQDVGPTNLPELVYEYRNCRDVLDEFSTLTGFTWDIDYENQLRMILPGTVMAPFNIVDGDGHAWNDVTVEPTQEDYANRILLRVGQGIRDVTGVVIVGDGAKRVYPLPVAAVSLPEGMTDNPPTGLYWNVATWVPEGSSFEWTYRSSDNAIVQSDQFPVLAAGDDRMVGKYSGQYPFIIQKDDAAQQALRGIYEDVISVPTVFSFATGDMLAAAYLAQRTLIKKRIQYETFEKGLVPGMTQMVSIASRGLNGMYCITDLSTRDTPEGLLLTTVKAIEGTVIMRSWRDLYKQWSQGGAGGTSISGSVGAGSGGGTAQQILQTLTYFLGGSMVEFVQTDTANAWVPASAVWIYHDTTLEGRLTGIVRVRTRSIIGGVQPRLQNITMNQTVGVGTYVPAAIPPNADWTVQSFPVTLTAGGNWYELQVLPSVPFADVAACGYLEFPGGGISTGGGGGGGGGGTGTGWVQ